MREINIGTNNPMFGRKGEKSGVFGRKWMNNGLENKYVYKEEIETHLNNGFQMGMLSKKKI